MTIPQPKMSPITPNNRYRVFAGFRGTDLAAAEVPYLIPPDMAINTEIRLNLPNLFQLPPAGVPVAPDVANDDFQFQWSAQQLGQVTPDKVGTVQARITIKNANAWRAGAGARQALRANYLDFCAKVEAYELKSAVLAEGGAAFIADRVAEALPAPISESLFFRTGFNPGFDGAGSPYVDLQPGMRLRVDFAANQFIAPGSPLNGLVGAGQSYFYVGRDNDQRVVFDTFLSAIAAPELAAPVGQATASGVLDLQGSGAARRHYRLIYPTQMPATTSPGDGRTTRNLTLLGAHTLAELQSATSLYTQSGEIAAAASGNPPIVALGFRGRAVIVPEIGVYVHRQIDYDERHSALTYVPVGTTLRQILDQQAGSWNPGQLYGEQGTIVLWRFWAEDNGVPQYRKLLLNPVRTTDVRVFDLPLAKSDILDIRFKMNS